MLNAQDARYEIRILEYAYIPDQPLGSILQGRHNGGTRRFPMTYSYIRGGGRNILVDVGVGRSRPNSLSLQARDHILGWKSPRALLAKVGVSPEEIDAIFITHAHFDHMDNLEAFPNATVYLQRREYEGCVHALGLEARYQGLNKALNREDFETLRALLGAGRVKLLDGDAEDILPGISVYLEEEGHSFGPQIVTARGLDGRKYVFAGDLVYSRENFVRGDDHTYVPVGLSVGGQMALMRAMDHLLRLAEGDLDRILIAHEPLNWELFQTHVDSEGLHLAAVTGDKKGR